MRRALPALLIAGLLAGVPGARAAPAALPPPHVAERIVRRALEDARALIREGRLEHAEYALRRGLQADPDHPRLHRTLAEVLEAEGRSDEAARARARADALDPPAGPLPDGPADLSAPAGLLVVVVPPEPDPARPGGFASRWPDGPELNALEARLGVRLPSARVMRADFESVPAARAWLAERRAPAVLTLRIDRAFCTNSIKDGRFAVGQLRASAAAAGGERAATRIAREVVYDPGPECPAQALGRALERALDAPELVASLAAATGGGAGYATPVIRELFPGLGQRIEEQLRSGEALLAAGEVAAAAEAFRRATAVDADDAAARTYLNEAEVTIALSRELDRRAGRPESGERLDPRLTPAQRASQEARLHEEEHRRGLLLAALAVIEEDVRAPDPGLLAALPASEIDDPGGFGPTLARRRAGGSVEARAAFAPDGALLARYYFASGSDEPVLREDDTNGDRRPDRWIAYDGWTRSDVYEAANGDRPTVRIVFAEAGRRVARVEIDEDADGRPNRILHYAGGVLVTESRDEDGDGRLDTFDHLDGDGRVAVREEDPDEDGVVDVRSVYERGRLVRRELSQPGLPQPERSQERGG